MTDTPSFASLRQDEWQNCFTGFGTSRDKMSYTTYVPDVPLTSMELEWLYYGSDIAAKIVDFKPKEMFREGYELRLDYNDGVKDPRIDTLKKRAKDLNLDFHVLWSLVWANLFGGCLLFLGLNDGQTVDKELNPEKVSKFSFIYTVDARYARAQDWYTDPNHPKFGQVMTYRIGNPLYGGTQLVHESRCIPLDGVYVDPVKRRSTGGWGISVLQRPFVAMRGFDTAFQSLGNMLTDASQGVFKLKGLIAAIASKNKDVIQERMRLVDMSRSSTRSLMLDAESGEDYQKIPTQFGGVADSIDRFMQRLSAACGIPVAILMGRSVAGLNATGDADFRAFYDTVASEQKNLLEPILQTLYGYIAMSEGMGKLEDLCVHFCSLWQPTKQEQAQTYSTVATADVAYINAGVLHPSEVALSRFGQAKFSLDMKIDVESREEELKQDIEFALNGDPNATDPNGQKGQTPADGQPIENPSDSGEPIREPASGDNARSPQSDSPA